MAKIPDQIGKYKILSVLGSGGSSIVYLGLHPTLKRKVVLKKLNLRGKKSFYERFVQEAALMMDLNHDHIVKVYDHFKEGSRHYMVMEFVEGASLDQIIEQSGPLQIETIRYILRCCCKALAYIHSRNIIHRDIKPSNIFISTRGEVKLGDFGIAKLDDPESENSSDGNPILGTPSYMAPEQFNPHGKITARTDIYALGVSYYELLTGQKLFYGDSLEDLRKSVLRGKHLSLYSVLKNYGFSCWRVIRRSTFRTPLLRYRRSQSMLRALSGFRVNDSYSIDDLSERTVARKSSRAGRTGNLQNKIDFADLMGQKSKSRPVSALFTVLIVSIIAFGSMAVWKSDAVYRYVLQRRYGAFTFNIVEKDQGESFPFDSLELFSGSETKGRIYYEDDLAKLKIFYKKSAYYQLMIRWGNRVEWFSFYLPPLSVQGEPREIKLMAPALISQPVELRIAVKDALSGEILNPQGAFFIRNSHDDWKEYGEGSMIFSGKSYDFKIAVPGYYERIFTRTLEFYEDKLFLNEELLPLPGKLIVHHNMERLTLKVNGFRTIHEGTQGTSVLKFGTLDMEGESWLMNPGVYQLQWLGRFSPHNQKLTIRSGESVIYRITSDAQGNPIFGMDRKQMESP